MDRWYETVTYLVVASFDIILCVACFNRSKAPDMLPEPWP